MGKSQRKIWHKAFLAAALKEKKREKGKLRDRERKYCQRPESLRT